jgi:uridine kinase
MIEQSIIKRDGRVVPFNREKIASAVYRAAVAVGGREREPAERVTDDVLRMLEARENPGTYPTVEEVQDCVEKALIERGHARTAKAYIVYRYEHALKRKGRQSLTYSEENIPYRKLWEALSWAIDRGCASLEGIAGLVRAGGYPGLIAACDAFYESELDAAAARALERRDEVRILIVAGPSSSGKTTTTLKIRERLAAAGVRTVPLTVDNYFFDLAMHPKVGQDDYDFETPQALDLALINAHLQALLDGRAVQVPHYDFRTGKREGIEGSFRLAKDEVLLIDSLHGLFPEMTAGIGEERKFRLYIETLSQVRDREGRYLRWADVRMLRRMVRDMQFRSYSPRQTVRHWHLVRRSELRYIVPELQRAHAIVNSFLAYELPIMRARVGPELEAMVREFEGDPEREDALERTRRVMRVFEELAVTVDESAVPPTSLLREFIGGSGYTYH